MKIETENYTDLEKNAYSRAFTLALKQTDGNEAAARLAGEAAVDALRRTARLIHMERVHGE